MEVFKKRGHRRSCECGAAGVAMAADGEGRSAAEFKDREPEVRLKIYDAVEEEVQSMSSSINLCVLCEVVMRGADGSSQDPLVECGGRRYHGQLCPYAQGVSHPYAPAPRMLYLSCSRAPCSPRLYRPLLLPPPTSLPRTFRGRISGTRSRHGRRIRLRRLLSRPTSGSCVPVGSSERRRERSGPAEDWRAVRALCFQFGGSSPSFDLVERDWRTTRSSLRRFRRKRRTSTIRTAMVPSLFFW